MKRISVILLALLLSACSTTADNRMQIASQHSKILGDIEQVSPGTLHEINDAPGFAIFSAAEVNLGLVSTGNGHGAVYNNLTSEKTYMEVVGGGIGLGVGGRDFRIIFVFKTEEKMQSFINEGWSFDERVEVTAMNSMIDGLVIGDITVYQFNKTGLSMQAMLKGMKFSMNEELNQ